MGIDLESAPVRGWQCLYSLFLVPWFALSIRELIMIADNQQSMMMQISNCSPTQVLPPPAVAGYLNIPAQPVASLLASDYSWYVQEWEWSNLYVYPFQSTKNGDPSYITTYDLKQRALCPVSPKVLKVNKVSVCSPGHTNNDNGAALTHRRLGGDGGGAGGNSNPCNEMQVNFNANCMSSPDSPPFKNPNIGWWYADDYSLYNAAAILVLVASGVIGFLFPFFIAAGGMYFAILYYILRMQSSSTIAAVTAEMFPSCTVDIHVKNKEHFAIVIFLATSTTFMVTLPLVLVALYLCCSSLKCCSTFSSSSSPSSSPPPPSATASSSIPMYSRNKTEEDAIEMTITGD